METITEDVGRLIAWMGEHGRFSIEGGTALWVNDVRLRNGYFVQFFRKRAGEEPEYTNGDDETLLGALHKAMGETGETGETT